MRLYVKGQNWSEAVQTIKWSGDTKQVARSLNFTLLANYSAPGLPRPDLEPGDTVVMQTDGGVNLFFGIIFTAERSAAGTTVSYVAYDLMFFVFNSSSSWIIDETPEAFAARVCAEFGVPTGFLQWTDVHVYSPALNKTGYQAIMMAYTEAYRQNHGLYAYIPLMDYDHLSVIPKGMDCEVVLEAGYNLTGATYSEDATSIVNKVLITDKTGARIGTVEDSGSLARYGTLQKVVQQQDGKDAYTEAEKTLKELRRAAKATGISDYRAVSGWSLLIREPATGLYGRFYIESDTHDFSNGKATMELTLEFDSIMDEHELENKE